MDSKYTPSSIEARFGPWWEKQGYARPSGKGEAYCIMIPPPNVTGSLHMGHGFQLSLMDTLIRYRRMQGYNTLWQVGTDHAGIATQMVVERNLALEGKERREMGREAFVKAVWDWKETSGGTITQQMRRLGASVDWSRERFTMDPTLSHAVVELFIRMHRDGLIYRGKRLVNWDPKLQTAISDLEIINEERNGNLWHIRYPLQDAPNTFLTVATTRPETLFGDRAVAVHPEDERYQDLIGKSLRLPLTDRCIPIIADADVDPEFGTGCVKITPAHDFNDYKMGERHGLTPLNIMHEDARMNENVPKAFQGLSREEARIAAIKALKAQNLLEKIEPHRHAVPIGDRSGVVIEPCLTDQWYVQCKTLAKYALKVVEEGTIRFHPDNHINTYKRWLENIEDWCISRQLWWGHRIPAWYDTQGNVYVGHNEEDVRRHYQLDESMTLRQEEDVLDTWFSSALWPFATLGWPEKTPEIQTFFPTQVLVTGHDILFFWVARMIMMSLYATGEVPFKDVLVTGLIRDEHNQKMSKSKGNIIDPIDLIEGCSLENLLKKRTHGLMMPEKKEAIERATKKLFPEGMQAFGTDALRFTFCALATTGRDVRFDVKRLEGYRNFCNKLWNASRFVLAQCEPGLIEKPSFEKCSWMDLWIQLQLAYVTKRAKQHLDNLRLDLLAKELYDFVWNDFCDWSIELAKFQIQHHPQNAITTKATLFYVLESTLRLLHPLIPFITEEIWQNCKPYLKDPSESIMCCPMPSSENLSTIQKHDNTPFHEALWNMNAVQSLTQAMRSMRSEMQIPPKTIVPMGISGLNQEQTTKLTSLLPCVEWLAKTTPAICQEAVQMPASAQVQISAHQVTGPTLQRLLNPTGTDLTPSLQCTAHLPLEGLINIQDEIRRIEKQLLKFEKQHTSLKKRMQSPGYHERAPKEVLEENKEQLSTLSHALKHYQSHLTTLKQLNRNTASN